MKLAKLNEILANNKEKLFLIYQTTPDGVGWSAVLARWNNKPKKPEPTMLEKLFFGKPKTPPRTYTIICTGFGRRKNQALDSLLERLDEKQLDYMEHLLAHLKDKE